MNLYFACSPSRKHISTLRKAGAKKLLFSYHFIKRADKLIDLLGDYAPDKVILDSGAFSVWSNGGTINIDDYADFALQFQAKMSPQTKLYITNLDVLPGKWGFVPTAQDIADSAKQGWQNMLYLEAKGLKVIHVFHQHEDFQILHDLMAHSDYIGISPANDVSIQEKLAWLRKCFSITRGNVKTHGFAVTSHKQVYDFPFYSVDSSSWVMPARFGRIPIFTDNLQIKSFVYKDINEAEKYWDYFKGLGMDKLSDKIDWQTRTEMSIKSYLRLEEIATLLWENRGLTWDNEIVDNPLALMT